MTAADRGPQRRGPDPVVADTYRFHGHCRRGGALPQQRRDRGAPPARRDRPLRGWLQENRVLDAAGCKQVWDEAAAEVEDAVVFALAGADPDPATALDDLYSDSRAAWSTP